MAQPFPFPPDWSEPLIERLEWATDVLTARSGNEQRIGLRDGARRSIEYSILLGSDDERALGETLLAAGVDGLYDLPLWTDAVALVEPAQAGDTVLQVDDTACRELVVGGDALVLHGSQYEAVQIQAVGPMSITLAGPLTRDWPVGARLAPTEPARLLDDTLLEYSSDAVATARMRWTLDREWLDGPEVRPLMLYLALDASGSMATTASNGVSRWVNQRTAVNAVLDVLELFVAGTERRRVDLMVVAYGGYPASRESILRRSLTVAGVGQVRTWLAAIVPTQWTHWPAGLADLEPFVSGGPSCAERLVVVSTDGVPEYTSGQSAAVKMSIAVQARAMIDAVGVPVHAVNIDLADTRYTSVIDTTPDDGVPVLDGGDPAALSSLVLRALGIAQYRGYWVHLQQTDWAARPPTSAWWRRLAVLDGEVGGRDVRDLPGIGQARMSHRWMLANRSEIQGLRGWLAARAGRKQPFWLPSSKGDVLLAAPASSGASTLTVRNRGLWRMFSGPDTAAGRRDLMFDLQDGQRIFARCVLVEQLDAETERLTLDAPLPRDLDPAQVRLISLLRLVRLESDAVEISYATPDVADAELSLRGLRDADIEVAP